MPAGTDGLRQPVLQQRLQQSHTCSVTIRLFAAAPNYNYGNQQGSYGSYNQADGRRYTTVTVTNRGQNGYRDDVVQQQVVCGSQYYDGYRTRTAPRC